jgi:carboxymethylenebutenolidase
VRTFEVPVAVPGGQTMPVALALPDGPGPYPGVVVVHEVFGLNDDIRAITRRFAEQGYAAAAPDLLSVGNRLGCLAQAFRTVFAFDTDGVVVGRLEAARAELARYRQVDAGRTGVIGFCLGGGLALAWAVPGRHQPLTAAAVNYGQVPADVSRLAGVCPLVASYGGRDVSLRGHAQRLETAAAAAGVPHDVKVYPEAGHSFLNQRAPGLLVRTAGRLVGRGSHEGGADGGADDRSDGGGAQPQTGRSRGGRGLPMGYEPASAADAWERIFAFFDTHLRAAG